MAGARRNWLLHSRNSPHLQQLELAVVPLSLSAAVHSQLTRDVEVSCVRCWQMVVEGDATEIEDHYKGGARHGRCSLRPVNSDRGERIAPAEGIVNGW